jgi:hypothetical protein
VRTKTIDVHVATLRRKLGAPECIVIVRRVGLRLGDTALASAPARVGEENTADHHSPAPPP